MAPRPIIIDCDPGEDDAVALLLALASPDELRVLGITCVAGNVPVELTHANALRICELAKRTDVPVCRGCARPLLRPLVTAESVHGKSGMEGCGLPPPSSHGDPRHAVDFIIETCLAAEDGEITLCAVGPLTNVAVAIVQERRILPKIREIVLMGGAAISPGNTTPVAEFNVYVDPHAAQVVFESGLELTMFGLDVTHKVLTTPDRLEAIRALGTPAADAVTGMLDFYGRHDVERYGMVGGPLHDPCVIAHLIHAEIFMGRRVRVDVEIVSEQTMGKTVADWWGVGDAEPNCLVMDDVDSDQFYALLTERLARL